MEKVVGPLISGVLARYPDGNRCDEVEPVPLHRSRHAKRGFNQA